MSTNSDHILRVPNTPKMRRFVETQLLPCLSTPVVKAPWEAWLREARIQAAAGEDTPDPTSTPPRGQLSPTSFDGIMYANGVVTEYAASVLRGERLDDDGDLVIIGPGQVAEGGRVVAGDGFDGSAYYTPAHMSGTGTESHQAPPCEGSEIPRAADTENSEAPRKKASPTASAAGSSKRI